MNCSCCCSWFEEWGVEKRKKKEVVWTWGVGSWELGSLVEVGCLSLCADLSSIHSSLFFILSSVGTKERKKVDKFKSLFMNNQFILFYIKIKYQIIFVKINCLSIRTK